MNLRISNIYFILCISFLIHNTALSQRSCGSNSLMEKFYQEVPEARSSNDQAIKLWKEKSKAGNRSSIEVTIPVHVIIVHPPGQAVGTGDNLSMDRIISQIDVLNQDFSGTNTDIVNVPSQFDTGASDIQFCLATSDPAGNPTNGVTRYETDLEFGTNNFFIMEQTIWDNSSYLNIYVTSTIQDLGFSPVASPAYTIPPMWDAPTVLTSSFGGPGFATLNNYDLGRTAVHEIGHWLGLNHLWGPTGGGCTEDDGMDDTPTQEDSTFGCPNHPLASCNNPAIFFMNFMDYVDDDCMLAFSEDQVDYMHFIIEQVRPGLIGANLTKCEDIVVPDPVVGTLLSTTNESCSGSFDGSVSISASGGTPPYSFSLDGSAAQTSGTFNNISGGNHTITIFDSQNQSGNIDFNIEIATPILVEIVAVTNPCGNNTNGSFGVVATGGNGGTINITLNQNMTAPNNFFTGLSSGIFTIQASDPQGCVEEIQYDLTSNIDPFAPITTDILYPSFDACETDPNSVNVQFTTDINDGINNITLSNGMTSSTGSFSNLSTGTYDYTASSPDGCQETGSFVIDQEYYYDINFTATPPSCASANDGRIIYTNNTDLQITVVMSVGTSTGPTTYENIEAGMHTVSVFGFNNCLLEEQTIDFSVNEIVTEIDEINPDCSTGLTDFQVSATGGTGLLTYSFNGMSNTTGLFEHVDPGTHEVIVTDENNCAQAILVNIQGVDAPISVNTTLGPDVLCFGETTFINIDVQGGAPPFEYILNGIPQNGPFIDNLGGGSYELIVRSGSECADDYVWQGEVIQYEELVMENITIIDSECSSAGGSFEAEIFDGSLPFYYILDQTDTFLISELPALEHGQHSIQAMDGNGCTSAPIDFFTTISEPISIEVEIEDNVSCFGEDDGKVNLFIDSNLGVTSYDWNLPVSNFQALTAGAYSLTVTNTDGCTALAEFEITQPDELMIETENLVPAGNLAGSAEFVMMGGTPPYSFNVNGIESEDGFFSLLQGDYEVDIADANGCSLTHVFTILFSTSTDDLENILDFSIYPNPTSNNLTIDCIECNTSTTFTIYTIEGKKIMEGQSLDTGNKIDVSRLNNGLYFLQVNHNGKSSTHRFMVI